MKYSISSILSFQLFGISMTGANICGTVGDVNQEVCGRWYQLAAFYPLARTFNGDNSTTGSREAWALQEPYKSAARNALTLRLSLVRYYYTIFFENYYNGGSFWKPLFFEFPDSDGSLDKIEETFMIGSSLKVTPVLKPLAANELITTYVPANTKFIDLIDLKTIIDGGSSGGYVNVQPNWNFPIVHLREGRIIPYQNFNESKTTYELVNIKSINLVVYADSSLNAEGTLYVDSDGVSAETLSSETFEYYKITYNDRKFRFILMEGYDAGGKIDMNQIVNNITIVDAAKYNDTNFACIFDENMQPRELGFTFYSGNNTLSLFAKDTTYVMNLRSMKNIQFGNTETDQNFCNPKYTTSAVEYTVSGDFADRKVSVLVQPNFKNLFPINVTFTLIKDDLINVEYLLQKNITEFQIPFVVLNNTLYPINTTFASGKIQSYLTLSGKGEEFYFEIHTKDNPSDIYYTTKGMSLIYTEFYKSMRSRVYFDRAFGLGERIGEFWLSSGTYTVWNRGVGKQEPDIGEPPGQNLYSSHPVYFAKRKYTNNFFAVYHHHSGPQDFVFRSTPDGTEVTTIRTTGRSNIFFLLSDSISNVVKNYYNLVGRPSLPPEWAFGWHQSRFGYNSTQALTNVYKGYQNIHLPLDAIWSDVDYMDDFRDFTVDNVNFKNLSNFVETIKANGTRYVPIIVAGVSAGDSDAYFEGIKQGVFVKSPNDPSQPIIGRATSGESVFVDFIMHNSRPYWKNQIDILYKLVQFDGIWLDMNEISSYCTGT